MKYQSVNSPHDFEFHDSVWRFVSHDSNTLVVQAKELNIHKNAAQADVDCDMEVLLAQITFTNWKPISFTPGAAWKTDEQGNSHPISPIVSYTGEQAAELFFHELGYDAYGATILEFEHLGDDIWEVNCCGDEPWFEMQFSFSDIVIEWDELFRPAWYVRHERGEI